MPVICSALSAAAEEQETCATGGTHANLGGGRASGSLAPQLRRLAELESDLLDETRQESCAQRINTLDQLQQQLKQTMASLEPLLEASSFTKQTPSPLGPSNLLPHTERRVWGSMPAAKGAWQGGADALSIGSTSSSSLARCAAERTQADETDAAGLGALPAAKSIPPPPLEGGSALRGDYPSNEGYPMGGSLSEALPIGDAECGGSARTSNPKSRRNGQAKGKGKPTRPHSASSAKRRANDKRHTPAATAQLVQPPWDWRPAPRNSHSAGATYHPGELLLLLQRAANEQPEDNGPKVDLWRSRWDAKWVSGGSSSGRGGSSVVKGVMRKNGLSRVPTSHQVERGPQSASHWNVVRARVGDIAQWY